MVSTAPAAVVSGMPSLPTSATQLDTILYQLSRKSEPSSLTLPAQATGLTVGELCQLNLERALKDNRKPGHHSYRCHSRLFTELWGSRPARELTRADVVDWARKHERDHAAATVRHRLGFLCSAYNVAIERGLLEANPAARIRPKAKIGKRHQWLDIEQEAKVKQVYLSHFGGMGDLFWGADRFAILTGCRQGEQAWLRPHHISQRVLKIPIEGKTGERLIPMHPEAYKIAQDWMEFSRQFSSGTHVFWPVAGDRNVIGRTWAKGAWNICRVAADLGDYQRRDLRRTFGSRLVQAGEPIYNVMKLLGHTCPQMTERYCQVDLMHLSAGVMRLQ